MFMVATLVVPQPRVNCCGLVTLNVGNPGFAPIEKVLDVEQPLTRLTIT
jgi:hypothetical protein